MTNDLDRNKVNKIKLIMYPKTLNTVNRKFSLTTAMPKNSNFEFYGSAVV